MYPIILHVVAVTAITVMLWFVVPTFTKMFDDMGAKLPGITQFVVDLSNFLVKNGLYLVAGVIVVVFGIRKFMQTESGRRFVGGFALTMPLVGELIVQSAMYRFASNIALLLKSGIPMLESLEVLEGVFQMSPHYRDALIRAQGRVAAGRAAGHVSGRDRPVHQHGHQHGSHRRGVGTACQRHGTNCPLLQGKNGGPYRQGHETPGAGHYHGHGRNHCRYDAGHLSADVRNGRRGPLSLEKHHEEVCCQW